MKKRKRSGGLEAFPWSAILTEYLYLRVPRNKLDKAGKLETYEAVANEYLGTYPDAVKNAVEAAVAEYGTLTCSDHVLAKLEPPFLAWARKVKKLDLTDEAARPY